MPEYPVLWTGMNDILIVPSPLVGEGYGEGGNGHNFHPLLSPPPSRGRKLLWMSHPVGGKVHFLINQTTKAQASHIAFSLLPACFLDLHFYKIYWTFPFRSAILVSSLWKEGLSCPIGVDSEDPSRPALWRDRLALDHKKIWMRPIREREETSRSICYSWSEWLWSRLQSGLYRPI